MVCGKKFDTSIILCFSGAFQCCRFFKPYVFCQNLQIFHMILFLGIVPQFPMRSVYERNSSACVSKTHMLPNPALIPLRHIFLIVLMSSELLERISRFQTRKKQQLLLMVHLGFFVEKG